LTADSKKEDRKRENLPEKNKTLKKFKHFNNIFLLNEDLMFIIIYANFYVSFFPVKPMRHRLRQRMLRLYYFQGVLNDAD